MAVVLSVDKLNLACEESIRSDASGQGEDYFDGRSTNALEWCDILLFGSGGRHGVIFKLQSSSCLEECKT